MPTPAAEYSSCKWSRQPYFAIRKTVVRCPLERQVTRGFLRSSGLIPWPQVSSALSQDTSANHRTFVSFSSSLQPEGTSINTSYEWPDTVYKTFRYEHNFNQAVTFHTSSHNLSVPGYSSQTKCGQNGPNAWKFHTQLMGMLNTHTVNIN
jgi:hypothetical protein